MKNSFITYELWCPMKNEPFYVGAGQHGRYLNHLAEARGYRDGTIHASSFNKHKLNKILKIWENNLDPKIKIVYTGERNEVFRLEIELIQKYGRADLGLGPLTNLTDGGDGGTFGIIDSEETKKKKSKANQGSNNNMYDKTHSDKARAKISENHHDFSGSKNPHAKVWKILDPAGNEYIICGTLIQFCKEHHLSDWTMAEMARKNRKAKSGGCVGWNCTFDNEVR